MRLAPTKPEFAARDRRRRHSAGRRPSGPDIEFKGEAGGMSGHGILLSIVSAQEGRESALDDAGECASQ